MRYQWNQLGRSENTSYSHKRQAGYVCPSCGIELYCEWYIPYDLAHNYNNQVNPDLQKMKDEATEFALLSKCPCCNGRLSHDSMYFIQVEPLDTMFHNTLFFFDIHTGIFYEDDLNRNTLRDRLLDDYQIFDSSFFTGKHKSKLDQMFEYLHARQQYLCNDYADQQLSNISVPSNFQNHETIHSQSAISTPNELCEYLSKIISIEKNTNFIRSRLLTLYKLIYKINKDVILATNYPIMMEKDLIRKSHLKKLEQLQANLNDELVEISKLEQQRNAIISSDISLSEPVYPPKPTEPQTPTLDSPGFFNRKKIQRENEKKTKEYNDKVAAYKQSLLDYRTTVEKLNKQHEQQRKDALENRQKDLASVDNLINQRKASYDKILTDIDIQKAKSNNISIQTSFKKAPPPLQIKKSLETEISIAEKAYSTLCRQKKQLYSAGIIFEKYHNFASISSFYEYISSGRCDTLTGPNGCYNLYEADLKANIIIEKLDNINVSLDLIKSNQYMLYSQIKLINENLNELNTTTNSAISFAQQATNQFFAHISTISNSSKIIAQNSSIIALLNSITTSNSTVSAYNSALSAHNSAITAHYAKLNAEIASADRYISVYHW